ncbi:helix-turn-helix domain-containing protein [Bacillus manliponensis]|uniref:helix-turn-helix domain-containing protein n=1 Tax=Bacillus manliponensis TaxID=574376 RepID=UPI003515C6F4
MKYEGTIQLAIDWIEEHLHEEICADDIAHIAGFSKYHFHRIFQNTVGMSVSEYTRMRRLTNAATVLLHTEERILDIALYLQFESQEAFTRAFKKMYRLPPGQFRRVMRDIVMTKKEVSSMEEQIKGWFLSGSHPFHYEMGTDREIVHQGRVSGYLKSKTVENGEQFATMMQQFKADKYVGKRIKLSGFIKTTDVEFFAGMWMRVDNAGDEVLQFDNMSDRPLVGTKHWNHYAIVLDVPENAATILFGILLSGKGKVWIDGLKFEEVDHNTPTTHMTFPVELLDEPTNLSFEEE